MTGSAKKLTEREQILKAMKTPPAEGYFVWDGRDEDDRPATEEELHAGIEAARRGRGRPPGLGVRNRLPSGLTAMFWLLFGPVVPDGKPE